MKKILLTTMFVFTLIACSPTDIAMKMLGGGGNAPHLDAEVTVGKKEESINTEVRAGDNQEAGIINNISEADPWLILVACIGWMLPSASDMWRGFMKLIPWSKR